MILRKRIISAFISVPGPVWEWTQENLRKKVVNYLWARLFINLNKSYILLLLFGMRCYILHTYTQHCGSKMCGFNNLRKFFEMPITKAWLRLGFINSSCTNIIYYLYPLLNLHPFPGGIFHNNGSRPFSPQVSFSKNSKI